MNRSKLFQALYDRAISDTGTGGLFNASAPLITGWYTEQGKAGAVEPYVVVTLADDGTLDTYAKQGLELTFYVHIYCPRENGNVNYAGLDVAETIRARIQGDGTPNSPTYGLHRWSTTLPSGSGMVASAMIREGGTSASDLNTVHLIETYTMRVMQS